LTCRANHRHKGSIPEFAGITERVSECGLSIPPMPSGMASMSLMSLQADLNLFASALDASGKSGAY
jgi:hypothetical protein